MIFGLDRALHRLPLPLRAPAAAALWALFEPESSARFEVLEVWYHNSAHSGRRKAVLMIAHLDRFTFQLFLIRDRSRRTAIVVGDIGTMPEHPSYC